MRTLTQRLVLTAVALVAIVSVLIALATTLAMRSYLDDRLDEDVRASLTLAYGAPPPRFDDDRDEARTSGTTPADGTTTGRAASARASARSAPVIDGTTGTGILLTDSGDGGFGAQEPLDPDVIAVLATVPADGDTHDVELPGLGEYRVIAEDRGLTAVAGLPASDAGEILESLVRWEALLTLLGIGDGRAGRHDRRTPPARAAARGRRHRPPGLREAALRGRDRPLRPGAGATDRRAQRGGPGGRRAQHPARPRRGEPRGPAPQRAAGPPVRRGRQPRAADPAGDHRRLHRARPAPARRAGHRAGQGGGRGGADDRAGRGPAAARPARRRPAPGPRARRPVAAADGGGQRRPGRRARPHLAARAARRARRGRRRRAAAAPGGDQPAHQRPQVHPARHHGHRDRPAGRLRRARRRARVRARGRRARLRALRARRRGPAPRGRRRASGSRSSGRSRARTAAPSPSTAGRAARRSAVDTCRDPGLARSSATRVGARSSGFAHAAVCANDRIPGADVVRRHARRPVRGHPGQRGQRADERVDEGLARHRGGVLPPR